MKLRDKNAIIEALKAGRKIHSIAFAPGIRGDERVNQIINEASKKKIRMMELAPARPGKGEKYFPIEAVCEDFTYKSLDDIRSSVEDAGKKALVIALDHLQDPRNLGAVLRTAAAARAQGVIIEKKRSCEVTDVVYETSSGGADRVPVVMVSNLRQALSTMKSWGLWIAGADEHAEEDCFSKDMSLASVLVFGSEGEGLHRLIREECDFIVRIPTSSTFSSLNISVAAGIMIFETVRQKSAGVSCGKNNIK